MQSAVWFSFSLIACERNAISGKRGYFDLLYSLPANLHASTGEIAPKTFYSKPMNIYYLQEEARQLSRLRLKVDDSQNQYVYVESVNRFPLVYIHIH